MFLKLYNKLENLFSTNSLISSAALNTVLVTAKSNDSGTQKRTVHMKL